MKAVIMTQIKNKNPVKANTFKPFCNRGDRHREKPKCVFTPLPGGRVYAKVFLIHSVEWTKVFHTAHIQVNQDNVLHLPAPAVQLTWTQATHYI